MWMFGSSKPFPRPITLVCRWYLYSKRELKFFIDYGERRLSRFCPGWESSCLSLIPATFESILVDIAFVSFGFRSLVMYGCSLTWFTRLNFLWSGLSRVTEMSSSMNIGFGMSREILLLSILSNGLWNCPVTFIWGWTRTWFRFVLLKNERLLGVWMLAICLVRCTELLASDDDYPSVGSCFWLALFWTLSSRFHLGDDLSSVAVADPLLLTPVDF